ncbi:alcohol dehydrogenase catalytic domain-containing protein [Streptomyces sp. 142MFCol3.1]|uniref:alcohol dehydrogenase catalytic domain-containing protein n=1 Tax=Streptomyces sp. 142MFCol3.1 TaxID=1172179 RepID=UPI003B63ED6D
MRPDPPCPHGLGLDGAGIADALGAGVAHTHVGRRVAHHGGPHRRGGFAEYALAAAAAQAPASDEAGAPARRTP